MEGAAKGRRVTCSCGNGAYLLVHVPCLSFPITLSTTTTLMITIHGTPTVTLYRANAGLLLFSETATQTSCFVVRLSTAWCIYHPHCPHCPCWILFSTDQLLYASSSLSSSFISFHTSLCALVVRCTRLCPHVNSGHFDYHWIELTIICQIHLQSPLLFFLPSRCRFACLTVEGLCLLDQDAQCPQPEGIDSSILKRPNWPGSRNYKVPKHPPEKCS